MTGLKKNLIKEVTWKKYC